MVKWLNGYMANLFNFYDVILNLSKVELADESIECQYVVSRILIRYNRTMVSENPPEDGSHHRIDQPEGSPGTLTFTEDNAEEQCSTLMGALDEAFPGLGFTVDWEPGQGNQEMGMIRLKISLLPIDPEAARHAFLIKTVLCKIGKPTKISEIIESCRDPVESYARGDDGRSI